ncbi:hypothetical protein A9R05_31770 (plasmid) [Burkholderia sp. KK1]|nr:hypothetical protein A9R05_31770 [Burkholderia sp. KK1]
MEICASEQACLAIAGLRRPGDKSGSFEIVQTAIERAHRLLGATGKQLATGEDRGVGASRIDGASQGGKQRTSARGQGGGVGRAMGSAKNHPRKIRSITGIFIERLLIVVGRGRFGSLRAKNRLACNGMLRDTHVKYVHFEKWKTNA